MLRKLLRLEPSNPKADRRSGIRTKHLAPGYSSCFRCQTAWKFVDGHSTPITKNTGCFPLCEDCWSELTPDQRLPFYYVLFSQWEWSASQDGREFEKQWQDIEDAVLAGL